MMPTPFKSSISRDVAAQELLSAVEYELKAESARKAGDMTAAAEHEYCAILAREQAEKVEKAND